MLHDMHRAEVLKGQDVLVACRLFSLEEGRREWSYSELGCDVGISASEAHAAAERCRRAQLLGSGGKVSRRHLRELLVSAVPRVFYAVRGSLALGTPTGVYARVLAGRFEPAPGSLPLVWPGEGDVRGESLSPVHASAPEAALHDEVVAELLALVDVVRVGSAAERERAVAMVDRRLGLRQEVKQQARSAAG